MKRIPLTKGLFTLVDDEDFEILSKTKWLTVNGTNAFYAGRNQNCGIKKCKTILLHREIMKAGPNQIVDHKNRDTLDNRKSNLRFCTASENQWNKGKMKNNTSGFKGAFLDKRHKKYFSSVSFKGKVKYLGTFKTAEAAGLAHARAVKQLHGDFAPI